MELIWRGTRAFAVALALLLACSANAAQEVRVAAVYFPPYVYQAEPGQTPGLLADLLAALNQAQSQFTFVMVPASMKRRFRDFEQQRIDLAIFENPAWGWQTLPHHAIDMGLEDSEVFVARAVPGRDQRYFDSLSDKRLALYHGYHYGFAGFNADADYLRATFNAKLSHSHKSNLLMVLNQRAEIALVTRSYIDEFLERNQQYAAQLLISERVDQRYRHHVIIRPGAPISPEQFSMIFKDVRSSGQLAQIFARHQIAVVPGLSDGSVAAGAAD